MDDWPNFGVISLIGGLVLAGIVYPGWAEAKGWPLGAWARTTGWSSYYLSSAVVVFFGSWHIAGIWGILLIIPISFLLAFLLTTVLGKHVQLVALLGLPTGVTFYFLTL